jgi:hypothetical protein
VDWSVEVRQDFGFARRTNTVPLAAVEFPQAAADYAIVFAGTEEALMPAVILGLQPEQNLFIDESGAWDSSYIPAFVRRYPFVFSSSDDAKTFTLCIDEGYPGFNRDGRGERLFQDGGERTEYLERVLDFLREYQLQFQRTRRFCDKLREFDLLEPVRADFTLKSGGQSTLTGFMVVNRERLKALSAERLAELARTDELELAYLHLHSLRNLQAMRARFEESAGEAPAAAEDSPSAARAPETVGKGNGADDGA